MLPINFHDKFLFRTRFGYCNEPKVVFLALKFSKALEFNIKLTGPNLDWFLELWHLWDCHCCLASLQQLEGSKMLNLCWCYCELLELLLGLFQRASVEPHHLQGVQQPKYCNWSNQVHNSSSKTLTIAGKHSSNFFGSILMCWRMQSSLSRTRCRRLLFIATNSRQALACHEGSNVDNESSKTKIIWIVKITS